MTHSNAFALTAQPIFWQAINLSSSIIRKQTYYLTNFEKKKKKKTLQTKNKQTNKNKTKTKTLSFSFRYEY